MAKDKMNVSIPASLYQRIQKKIEKSEGESVSGYIIRILEESLQEQGTEEDFSKEDEEKVRERLKALGYID